MVDKVGLLVGSIVGKVGLLVGSIVGIVGCKEVGVFEGLALYAQHTALEGNVHVLVG